MGKLPHGSTAKRYARILSIHQRHYPDKRGTCIQCGAVRPLTLMRINYAAVQIATAVFNQENMGYKSYLVCSDCYDPVLMRGRKL